MERMISVALAGHDQRFDIDELGFQRLKRYLDESRHQLASDPDRDEVLHDLEQSIGDKLSLLDLGDARTIGMADMEAILAEVGAIESEDVSKLPALNPRTKSRRRFYRIKEGQQIAGVCNGIAVDGEFDVAWVRTVFVLLGLFSGGVFIIVYFILALWLPVLPTREDYLTAKSSLA